jgi:DNA-binding NarL/FixJ family response regulator
VLAGGVYVTPLLEMDRIFSWDNGHSSEDPLRILSAREYQVFLLLVEGVRAKEIAARLALSPKTIDTYRASLMRKLEIFDLAGLVKFALNRGLTTAAGA